MKTANILFPIAFLILSYYLIIEEGLLVDMSDYDIVRQVLFVIAALFMAVTSIIDLKKLKNKSFKKKWGVTFSLASSLIFLLATVFALIAY